MMALVDGDIVAYRCAASCEQQGVVMEPENIAIARADELIRRILQETGSDSQRCFLSGAHNFRKKLWPEYKAHREGVRRPDHLPAVQEFLRQQWNAESIDTLEADDLMGIAQSSAQQESTIICSLDKDMLQVPGFHYNWVKQERLHIEEIHGWQNYYFQLIMGDRADNIPGYDGKMRQKVPKFLQGAVDQLYSLYDPEEMQQYVADMYDDPAQFEINLKLFWILRDFPITHGEEKTTTNSME